MDYVDYGTAPVHPVEAMARADRLGGGNFNFAFWAWRTTVVRGQLVRQREVVCNLLMHNDGAGQCVDMAFQALGNLYVQAPATVSCCCPECPHSRANSIVAPLT